jgi:hypothetical protein
MTTTGATRSTGATTGNTGKARDKGICTKTGKARTRCSCPECYKPTRELIKIIESMISDRHKLDTISY